MQCLFALANHFLGHTSFKFDWHKLFSCFLLYFMEALFDNLRVLLQVKRHRTLMNRANQLAASKVLTQIKFCFISALTRLQQKDRQHNNNNTVRLFSSLPFKDSLSVFSSAWLRTNQRSDLLINYRN